MSTLITTAMPHPGRTAPTTAEQPAAPISQAHTHPATTPEAAR